MTRRELFDYQFKLSAEVQRSDLPDLSLVSLSHELTYKEKWKTVKSTVKQSYLDSKLLKYCDL